ncbi:GRB10-interacting GYF protein 2 isoform 3-T3 [Liasis olivaceus]
MAAETQTLNFGPEWLRALSSGGSVTSPPLSPALPKYKLADYRYGREEMLALFLKDNKRNFSVSVNSAAVLRLMGRGGGTVVGAPRGRSSSRGRGRGRGESAFYQRSFDDVEGGFGRGGGREMHRSQSWEERGDRRFEKTGRKEPVRPNFEEAGTTTVGRKHEFIRSESENWRIFREEQNGEDDDGGWRLAGSRRDGERWRPHSPDGPRSAGWREHMERRRRFEFDFRDRDDERGYRRVRCGSGSMEDDRDNLPEWCLEDAEEEMGTFDSSGAFLSLKKVQKEPIPEEQEMDFHPIEEREDESDSEESHNEEAKELDKTHSREGVKTERMIAGLFISEVTEETVKESSPSTRSGTSPKPQSQEPLPTSLIERKEDCILEATETSEFEESQMEDVPSAKVPSREDLPPTVQSLPQVPPEVVSPIPPSDSSTNSALRCVQTSVIAAPGMGNALTDPDDEEGLKHLEQQAEKMVAYLQDSALDDERLAAKLQEQRTKGTSVPLHHESMQKWFYKDPQGEIQGPFSNQEMTEWFQAGYFTMSLLVKRACDDSFQPLGDIMKMWGRVPFTPGPASPLHMGELDQERLTRQQEFTAMYQMQHLQYQQFLLQQQYAQVMAQQQKAAVSSQQQQQQQQLALLLQQFQALKMRKVEQNMVSPVTRSVSDTSSIWELQSTAPQTTVWEGSSVWDLPIDTAAQGPALEQLQQLEKAKAAKLEQERREAELRAKREEEERKRQEELRRQQEELIRRQEEERKRREEEELARRKQEEALRRQREQEIALRRQREEEERQQQEEALRRLEERRREEEERRQREELLRKQEEEAAKWAREEEAKRQVEENRLRMEEEAAQRQEEEERKRKELELQRQKEIMRQRQQQQEALRRLQQQQQQQQLAQMKLPSSSTWGQQSSSRACQSQATLSLAEIQKLEEEREKQLREEQRRQQRELMKALQQQQQQQQQKLSGWGNVAKSAGTTKSLLEIQQEEARQMQKQQHQQQQSRSRSTTQHSNLHTSIGNSVWGSLSTNPSSQWASDLVSSIWSNADTKNSNMGFWDDAVKEVGPRNATNKNKSNASISKSIGVTSRHNKKVEEEEKLLKLFQGVNKPQDGFTQWCEQMLHALNTANNLDVPTFVSFLKEVESPYEVHDYIRAYLGDTPEAKEFAKQFLERRAKQKANQQRQQQDSVWGMNHTSLHTVFQTNQSNNQQSSFEAVQSGKKKKKQKMVRADPSLLGFSVNASSERLNMGEIETLDDY